LGRAAPIHVEVLPNGLTLLLREAHLAPVAEVQIWANVGSADEAPGEAGLAHFHEHMLFKGTERRGVGDVAGEVEGAGGHINAYTSFDVTVYHATIPSERLDVAVDVLCDAVLRSSFAEEEIAREIEVVLEEIRRSDDSPAHVLDDAVFQAAYRMHPYRLPILGTAENVSSFDRAKVRAFYERWYAPANLTVVASGDFEAPRLAETLREAFAGGGPAPKHGRAPEPAQAGLRTALLPRPFERARLELAWPSVGLGHPDTPLLDLLAFVLGEGDSSRLARRVRERDALVEDIDAASFTPREPGLFSVVAETTTERVPACVESAVREVERLRTERVPAEELEKARANFLASEHFEHESVTGLAQRLGSFQLLAGDHRLADRYLERIRSATPEDLLRVARGHLAEHLTVGVVFPQADARRLSEDDVTAAVQRGRDITTRAFRPPRPLGARHEIHSYELASGARLHVQRRPDVPVFAARAAFRGGLLAEDAATAGLTRFLSSLWLRGTRSHSAADFARTAESRAVEIDGFAGRSSFGLTAESTREQLAPALELFSEVLLEPAFAPEELERERREALAAIDRREDRLAQRAFLLFAQTLYPTHPYGQPILGHRETVSAFDRDLVAAHHAKLVRGPNLVMGVAGDVDPDDVAARVSARLSELSSEAGDSEPPPMEPAPRELRRAEIQKDRAQAHLVVGFRGLTVDDPDRFALEVIAQLLAGQGGRLFLELRDRRGLAYALNAVNVEGLQPGFFAVYIATAPEKHDEARRGVFDELEALRAAPPPDDELARAKHFLAGSFLIDEQRSAARAAHMALDSLYGLGPDASRRYAAQVEAVTKDDVLRVARRVVDLDCATLAVVKP